MITLRKKFYASTVIDHWFDVNHTFQNLFTLRAYSFILPNKKSPRYCLSEKSHTLLLNLKEDLSVIESRFHANLRNELKKAQFYAFKCEQKNDPALFYELYKSFARLKKIYVPPYTTIQSVLPFYKTTFIYHADQIIAGHSYIVDETLGIVRLFQSASVRLHDNINSKMVGYANRALTKFDIQYFKNQGFEVLDFGGYSLNERDKALQGINHFKKQFGGHLTELINYNSIPYHLLKKVLYTLDRRFVQS